MAQFFKFLFASCLGVILASVIIFLLGMAWVMGMASATEKPKEVRPNSVLKVEFNQPIPEQTNNLQMNPFDLQNQKILGLSAIVQTIEAATTDDNIQGILLDLDFVNMGLSSASTVRDALLAFKESGKFIVSNSKYYSQGAYYLASTSDKIFLNPAGNVDLHGFSAMMPFYKEMLDNLGINMQVFYAGKYKSATEPFRRYNMSEENRLQLHEYLLPTFKTFLSEIGESRGKSQQELWDIADGLLVRNAEDALSYGLVDANGYYDEVVSDMKERIGLEDDDDLYLVDLGDYNQTADLGKDFSVKDKIAVIYAEGAIITGDGEPGQIGDDKYTKFIRKARKDKRVKAIVLRVNSPGGSPIASENILRELELAKEDGKPVVISMGDYAASGGYYISCNADHIVAEENTLTGSIGVFLMIPNMKGLMQDKLGWNFDTVRTTRYSTGLTTYYPVEGEEANYLNQVTQNYYKMFKERVSAGRDLSMEQVETIAQGRVWSGEDALEVGLVDELGGLENALAKAADLSGLEKYRITEYPKVKDPVQLLLEELTGQESAIKSSILENELGEYYSDYKYLKEMIEMKGPQARLPLKIEFR